MVNFDTASACGESLTHMFIIPNPNAILPASGELKDTRASGLSSSKYSNKSLLLSKLALNLFLNSLPPWLPINTASICLFRQISSDSLYLREVTTT